MRWGIPVTGLAFLAAAAATRLPEQGWTLALLLGFLTSSVACLAFAAGRGATWARRGGALAALGLLMLPRSHEPALAVPAPVVALLGLALLHQLAVGARALPPSLNGAQRGAGRARLALAVLLVVGLLAAAAFPPATAWLAWGDAREARLGAAALYGGAVLLLAFGAVGMARAAFATREGPA